jgi:hypothetical protein
MLKKEFCANYSVAAVKSFRVQAEEDLEERLIYCCAAILLLLSLNYCSMSIKLLLGAFSLLEKDHLLLDLLSMLPRILKLEKLFLKVVP